MPNIKLPADRTRDQFRVHCYQIIGTDIVVFTAHERAEAGSLLGIQHTCIQTFDDTWYGRICSRPLPADINAIPVGNERFDKCAANRKANIKESHELIYSLFPELTSEYTEWDDSGEVVVSTNTIRRLFPELNQ